MRISLKRLSKKQMMVMMTLKLLLFLVEPGLVVEVVLEKRRLLVTPTTLGVFLKVLVGETVFPLIQQLKKVGPDCNALWRHLQLILSLMLVSTYLVAFLLLVLENCLINPSLLVQ